MKTNLKASKSQRKSRWVKPMLEQLEDRTLLSGGVAVGQFTGNSGWAKNFFSDVNTTILAATALAEAVPGLGNSFQTTLQNANVIQSELNTALTQLQSAAVGSTDLYTFLTTKLASGSGNVTGGLFVASSVVPTNMGNTLTFTLDVRPANVDASVPLNLNVGGLKLVPNGASFELSNAVLITTQVIVDNTSNFDFNPAATTVTYTPTAHIAGINVSGTLGGFASYVGSANVDLAPTFTFTFSGSSPASLGTLITNAQVATPTGSAAELTVTLDATLNASPLPALEYQNQLQINVVTGNLDTPLDTGHFLVGGDDVTTSAGQTKLVEGVLGQAGAQVFNQIRALIPLPLAQLLLGKVDIYQGYQLTTLLGGETPVDILGDFFGVPPPVITVAKDILQASIFANTLKKIGDSNVDSVKQQAKDLGVDFPIIDNPLTSLIQILKGNTVDLVTWNVNLATEPGIPQSLIHTNVPNTNGGTSTYIEATFMQTAAQMKARVEAAAYAAGPIAGDAVKFILDNSFSADFSLNLDIKLQAALTVGLDSSFLTHGGSLADSFFLDTGNIIDAQLNAKIDVKANAADVVPGGNIVKNGANGLGKLLSGGSDNNVGDQIASDIFNADVHLKIAGGFLFGICDAPNPITPGKLRGSEIGNIASLLAFQANLDVEFQGTAHLANVGGPFDFSSPPFFTFAIGCTPTPNGPGSPTNTVTPMAMPDIIKVQQNGSTLDITGTSDANDVQIFDLGNNVIELHRSTTFSDGTSHSDPLLDIDLTATGITKLSVDLMGGDNNFSMATGLNLPVNLDVADGNNTIQTGAGADHITTGNGKNIITTGDGNDYVGIGAGDNKVTTGNGNDTVQEIDLLTKGGANTVYLGSGTDNVTLRDGNNTVAGGGGNTEIIVGAGDNNLSAGDGAMVTIIGGGGNNTFQGGAGMDYLYGDADQKDLFYGGAGHAVMTGAKTTNIFFAGTGTASMLGGAGANIFYWQDGDGNQIMDGGTGNSLLIAAGSNAINDFTLTANGAQAVLSRTVPTATTLDTSRIQTIIVGEGSGASSFTVSDLTGTAVTGVAVAFDTHLSMQDQVTLNGRTTSDNSLANTTAAGYIDVNGLDAEVVIAGTNPSDHLTVNGNGGNDILSADGSVLQHISVTLQGGAGNNTLAVGDFGGGGSANPAGDVTLIGGSQQDNFAVINPAGTVLAPDAGITIKGNGGPNESLILVRGGGAGYTENYSVGAAAKAGTVVTSGPAIFQTVHITGVDEILDSVTVDQLTINATAQADNISVTDGGVVGSLTETKVAIGAFPDMKFADKAAVIINGLNGGDAFMVDNPTAATGLTSLVLNGDGSAHDDNAADVFTVLAVPMGVTTSINGGGGSDTLIVPTLTANVWHITGQDAGDVNGLFTFTSIENLTGGSGADRFEFADAKGEDGIIDGADGANTLDYHLYATNHPITVNLQTQTATGTGGFRRIQNLIGGASHADTLIGADTFNTWHVQSANAGDVNGLFTFSSIENLTGGANGDFFVFANQATVDGAVDGAGGYNFLDFSAYLTSLVTTLLGFGKLDGFLGSMTGLGRGFTNISTIYGGAAPDVITGLNLTSTWGIGALGDESVYASGGRTLGFRRFETVNGGTAPNTFNVYGISVPFTLNGNSGQDVFDVVQVDRIKSSLTIVGNVPGDTAVVNASADAAPEVVSVTATDIGAVPGDRFFAPGGFLNYYGLADLALFGGSGGNVLNLYSKTPGMALELNAGLGNDVINAYVNRASAYANVLVNGEAGADVLNVIDTVGGAVMHNVIGGPGFGDVTTCYLTGARSFIDYEALSQVVTNPDADHSYVQTLYHQFLQRDGSMAELDGWVGVLNQTHDRSKVANAILRSEEARDLLVQGWYAKYMGRTAVGGEEGGWVQMLLKGQTEENVLSTILDSPEYYARAGNSDAVFVQQLFHDALGRGAGSDEVSAWLRAISPLVGRGGMARLVFNSVEYRGDVIHDSYDHELGRAEAPAEGVRFPGLFERGEPSDNEILGWVFSGLDLTSLRVGFASSQEFFDRAC
jgi:hypothetical protein